MPKQVYIPFICGRCELQFGIHKKHYNSKDTYLCPICRVDRVASMEVEKPVKPFRRKRVSPTIFKEDDL